MRITLVIDDDVLAAARTISERQGRSLGAVVSDRARQSLLPPAALAERNGVPLLPVSHSKAQVTRDVVNALRDEAP